jgi:hypothetical protein
LVTGDWLLVPLSMLVPRLSSLLVVSLALPAGAAVADPNFNDGLWRVDIVTEMRGAGLEPAPPYNIQGCYSREEITRRLAAPGGPCRAVPTEARDDQMSWRLQCSPRVGEVNGRIHMKFLGDRMEGTVHTRTAYPEPLEVTQRISGRRLGDCKVERGQGAAPGRGLRDYNETR